MIVRANNGPLRERIEIDPDRAPVLIPGRLLNEMCAHALETRPEECCGLVAGTRSAGYDAVHRCRNTMTQQHQNDPMRYPRDGRHAYYMSEVDYLRAEQEALGRDGEVMAVYHSHVSAGVYLSEMDQDFAEHAFFPFPSAAQIVLAVGAANVDRVLGAGIFERDPVSGRFYGRALKALPDGVSPDAIRPNQT
jgi:proteasome lid subunit RPN8/RPN11